MFFKSRIFVRWYIGMMVLWVALVSTFSSLPFLIEHWYYPAIMVLGAFVAGLTPEGGGAVAFPVLSVFLDIDRGMARDFSLMIQSVGMTSASIWILTRNTTRLSAYKPVLWFVPVGFFGFIFGMNLMQAIPVFIIQALFLSLIMTFAVAYLASRHRGHRSSLPVTGVIDRLMLAGILFAGGICASLFGTGADIVLYTLLVTRFRLDEKIATHQSIMVMAAISLLGYGYRAFWDQEISAYQVGTWLCAYPVVLLMAPLGSYVLSKVKIDWMLRGIVVLNIFQMVYFNLKSPTPEKLAYSVGFSLVLFAVFWLTLGRLSRKA